MMRWFDTLTSRTILLLLIGIGIVHLASLYAYQLALNQEVITAGEVRLADRLLAIKRAVMRVPPAEREPVAHDLSGGPIEAHWSRSEHAIPGGPGSVEWDGLKRQLQELAPELTGSQIIIGANRALSSDPHLAMISMQLPDDSWINISLFSRLTPQPSHHGTILSTSLMALGVIGLSILVVRWMTQPLRTFADAARQLYGGAEHKPVPEQGPREVRELATAFNDMQARITQLIDDRTQALAAVSHDLKTPLTRLRLKAEDMPDQNAAGAIRSDLSEMEEMIDQTLSYLRGDRADEEVRLIDVAAILATLIDEASDAGHSAVMQSSEAAVIRGRPLALRRALSNVIQNAIKYGKSVIVSVRMDGNDVEILVDDLGPGIAADQIEMAFAPFTRLEASRNKETGGFGLGLTITRTIIKGHQGTIQLANREGHGLRVQITLPKAGPTA